MQCMNVMYYEMPLSSTMKSHMKLLDVTLFEKCAHLNVSPFRARGGGGGLIRIQYMCNLF